jgi:hypothetical protein
MANLRTVMSYIAASLHWTREVKKLAAVNAIQREMISRQQARITALRNERDAGERVIEASQKVQVALIKLVISLRSGTSCKFRNN